MINFLKFIKLLILLIKTLKLKIEKTHWLMIMVDDYDLNLDKQIFRFEYKNES